MKLVVPALVTAFSTVTEVPDATVKIPEFTVSDFAVKIPFVAVL